MSSYCEYINCACKYCEEGHCDFPIQGSGYPYDAPCFGYNKEEMSRELKPCPWCGDRNSHAVFNGVAHIDGDRKVVYGVRCDHCGYVNLSFISEKDAINEWNKGVTE